MSNKGKGMVARRKGERGKGLKVRGGYEGFDGEEVRARRFPRPLSIWNDHQYRTQIEFAAICPIIVIQ